MNCCDYGCDQSHGCPAHCTPLTSKHGAEQVDTDTTDDSDPLCNPLSFIDFATMVLFRTAIVVAFFCVCGFLFLRFNIA